MPKVIKTRDTVKDVKTFDRAANVSAHMKNATIKSKEIAESADRQAEQTQDAGQNSPSGYASDKMTDGAKKTTDGAVRVIKKNPVKKASENINKVKDNIQEVKRQGQKIKNAVKGGQPKKEMVKRAVDRRTASRARQTADKTVKTVQKSEKTIKQAARGADKTIKTASKTVKGTAKATQRTVKTAEQTSKVAIKTTKQTVKATQRAAQAAVRTAKMAAQTAKVAAKAAVQGAKIAAKVLMATIKAIIAAAKALIAAIAAGGWIAVLIILLICLVAMLVGSVFGVFFSGDEAVGNSMTISQAVTQINDGFQADIQARADALAAHGSYDEVRIVYEGDLEGDSDAPNNWTDVLTIYSVKTTSEDMEVLTFDEERLALLKDVFNQMNQVSTCHEVIRETVPADPFSPSSQSRTQTVLIVYVTVISQAYKEAAAHYGFTEEQMELAEELMSPEYYTLFASLMGVDITGGADLTQIISNLPLGERGTVIVEAALTRLGHPYSQPERGSGNYVDCSYLARWAYAQAGVTIPGTSDTQAKYCYDNSYNIGKSELQPGDLIFWSKLSCHCGRWNEIHHVGIYIGDNKVVEASSSKGRVVISELWGENGTKWRIHSYARPYV